MNKQDKTFINESVLRDAMAQHGTSLLKLVYSYVQDWSTAEAIVLDYYYLVFNRYFAIIIVN
ncbi:hypothetical protein SH601_11025 [Gracilibacillus sp. S3-1-1]|uniref:Uncharacterized protein n=1 Tax=Gracilibacillus pellucidus TaxID=3095368 RepID=A0ACC6M6B1_9BACI|nr:hypothetical protein [Gracilibacillus sp. S3-1-1]MDX8046515.1 hypothetical protein [Gracilibacillus sp. S3-1-1]